MKLRFIAAAALVVCLLARSSTAVTLTDNTSAGSITAVAAPGNAGSVCVSTSGSGTTSIGVSGTWTGTLAFKYTQDGSGFLAVPGAIPNAGGPAVTGTTANGQWSLSSAGYSQICVHASAWTSGTAIITLNANPTAFTGAAGALPAGSATSAKQDTGNTSLSSIDGKLPAVLDANGRLKTADLRTDTSVSGTISSTVCPGPGSAAGCVVIPLGKGQSTVSMFLFNVVAGSGALQVEGTVDNSNWFSINAFLPSAGQFTSMLPVPFDSSSLNVLASSAGLLAFRLRASAWAAGTVDVVITASVAVGPILPDGIFSIAPSGFKGLETISCGGGTSPCTIGAVSTAVLPDETSNVVFVRFGCLLQNVGTTDFYCKKGGSAATINNYDFILKPASGANKGDGGVYTCGDGAIQYIGQIQCLSSGADGLLAASAGKSN